LELPGAAPLPWLAADHRPDRPCTLGVGLVFENQAENPQVYRTLQAVLGAIKRACEDVAARVPPEGQGYLANLLLFRAALIQASIFATSPAGSAFIGGIAAAPPLRWIALLKRLALGLPGTITFPSLSPSLGWHRT